MLLAIMDVSARAMVDKLSMRSSSRRQLARKRPVDPDESVANEMLDVGITERAHRQRLTASHDVLAGFVGLDSGNCQQAELATLIVADNLC